MYTILRPFLFRLGPEVAHGVGVGGARFVQAIRPQLLSPFFAFEHESLRQFQWGIEFKNPIGLAAGFDKNGLLPLFWASVGFGFAEIGSVTAEASGGNSKPRLFRLEQDQALVNRMGLNNHGAFVIAKRLARFQGHMPLPLGINIAKTNKQGLSGEAAVDDFLTSFRQLVERASYIVLNVSCPNTDDGKTFEDPKTLDILLAGILRERAERRLRIPILIKLSPPIFERFVFDSMLDEIVALGINHGIDGFIACNTTTDRSGLMTSEARLARIGQGGLSGAPLEERSTRMVRYIYQKSKGALPIVGTGGVRSPETAYAKILAGASLLQLYTALVYEGPGVVRKIKTGLVSLLQRDGFRNIREAVGAEDRVAALQERRQSQRQPVSA